jgi:hypothetical protein
MSLVGWGNYIYAVIVLKIRLFPAFFTSVIFENLRIVANILGGQKAV